MSDGSGRGGLWVAVLIVLAVLGIAAWFTIGGGTAAYDAPGGGHALSKPDSQPADVPGFHATETAEPVPLNPQPSPETGHPPALVGAAAAAAAPPPANASHVVAKGHVRWAGGKVPFESDVKLYDADASDIDFTSTDEEGAFELSSDEPLEAGWSFGTDAIDVPYKGRTVSLLPSLVADLPAHAVGDPPVERDLVIGYGPVLVGRVVDQATNAPIAGAEVHVVSTFAPYAFDVLDADTGPDGRYTLPLENLPLNGLIVWCRADDYQALLAGPLDLQPVASPDDAATQDFALSAALTVKGHVTDARTHEPIDGAVINIGSRFQAFSDANDFELTDETGSFELDAAEIPLEGGWLVVTASDCAPELVPLQKGTAFVEVALGAPVSVTGTVLDETGRAVPNARVQIVFDGDTPDLDQQMYDQADCDTDGRFETKLELVPDRNAILRVDQVGKRPFKARLTDIGRALPGNRWDVELRLAKR